MFLGLFALDALSESKSLVQAFPDLLIHFAPGAVLGAIVAASWRWDWVGGVAFITVALIYGTLQTNRLDWIFAISGPLSIVGALYLWSWHHHTELRAQR